MSNILDSKIDFLVANEDTIMTQLLTRAMAVQNVYGKVNTMLSIEIAKLLFLLKNKGWYGENTRLALYQKLLDMTRKQGLINHVPEIQPTYLYPLYYGPAAPGLLEADIPTTLLPDSSTKEDKTYPYTTDGTQVYYYCYPKKWGILSRIYDQNGYNTIDGYTRRDVKVIVNSINKDYYLYEFNAVSMVTSFTINFVF